MEELDIATHICRVLTIKDNPYDTDGLRTAIEAALNDSTKKLGGSYTVTRSTASGDITSAASGTAYRFFSIEYKGGGVSGSAREVLAGSGVAANALDGIRWRRLRHDKPTEHQRALPVRKH